MLERAKRHRGNAEKELQEYRREKTGKGRGKSRREETREKKNLGTGKRTNIYGKDQKEKGNRKGHVMKSRKEKEEITGGTCRRHRGQRRRRNLGQRSKKRTLERIRLLKNVTSKTDKNKEIKAEVRREEGRERKTWRGG